MRHRMYQIGYVGCFFLLLAAAVVATAWQRFFVAAILPGIAFALAGLWFRRRARALSEPGPGFARIDIQSRTEYWNAPEISQFRIRPRLVAKLASMTPGTLGCFLDIGPAGLIIWPSQLMRLIGIARTEFDWRVIDLAEVQLGRGALGNSLVLRFAQSGEAFVARYPADVDIAPTVAAAVAQSGNPDLVVATAHADAPRWQAW